MNHFWNKLFDDDDDDDERPDEDSDFWSRKMILLCLVLFIFES